MNRLLLGLIFGLGFGTLDVLIMIPLKYEDSRKKKEAMASAFIDRFMIGFLIPNISIGIQPAIWGAFIGLGFSVPTAIITRVYAPIIVTGTLGGLVIGILTQLFI